LRNGSGPPRPNDLWIGSRDVDAAMAAATQVVGPGVRIDRADDPASRTILGSASVALWATAAACLALAVIAVAAAMREQQRSRRGDIAVLRALGLGSRQQGRLRRAEYFGWIGYGIAAGLLTGLATVLLTVSPFARAAVPAAHPGLGTDVAVDLVGLLTGFTLLAVAVTIVVAIAVRAVRRDATRTLPEATR
jgi:predicted lysophospholipase L1 biosynthesis ABC-type transport system permease subunit